jgi:hypothetical protein
MVLTRKAEEMTAAIGPAERQHATRAEAEHQLSRGAAAATAALAVAQRCGAAGKHLAPFGPQVAHGHETITGEIEAGDVAGADRDQIGGAATAPFAVIAMPRASA